MKKLIALLAAIALLTVLVAGCTPTEEKPVESGSGVSEPVDTGVPDNSESAPTDESTAPTTADAPQATTGPTVGVGIFEETEAPEDDEGAYEIDFDDLLANS